ncbi:hypothetical protein LC925_10325, partial [Enterococcus faecium]|nr:hypothetical protein [Enterococcus faecium]
TVTLIPNGIHHPPIEDGRLLPNSVKQLLYRITTFSIFPLVILSINWFNPFVVVDSTTKMILSNFKA